MARSWNAFDGRLRAAEFANGDGRRERGAVCAVLAVLSGLVNSGPIEPVCSRAERRVMP
jgi:hypothetical protein